MISNEHAILYDGRNGSNQVYQQSYQPQVYYPQVDSNQQDELNVEGSNFNEYPPFPSNTRDQRLYIEKYHPDEQTLKRLVGEQRITATKVLLILMTVFTSINLALTLIGLLLIFVVPIPLVGTIVVFVAMNLFTAVLPLSIVALCLEPSFSTLKPDLFKSRRRNTIIVFSVALIVLIVGCVVFAVGILKTIQYFNDL